MRARSLTIGLGIWHELGHHTPAVLGNPNLLHKIRDIPALLPQGSCVGEQATALNPSLVGWNATAVPRPIPALALNHRLAKDMLVGIVRSYGIFDLKEGSEAIGNWQQIMAAADRFDPRLSLVALVTKYEHLP